MPDTPDIAAVAALVGDPTRGRMLAALMHGRALTATELALEGGVTPSTASIHLSRLTAARLISTTSQGRHRYFRIAAPEVAAAIEGLRRIAPRRARGAVRSGPGDKGLRRARVCYDHLAGEIGVRLLEGLRRKGYVAGADDAMEITSAGERWCGRIGVDLEVLGARRRPLCRPCLDWTERRTHLAGALGAAILDRMFALRLARRERGGRALRLSSKGEAFVVRLGVPSSS